ncbi:MAG: AgmX/PglI C-terminal domain-containing protein, partial [Bdellovibrionales bacterium]|nr:AgmX/PglI C-terminal domain-containing protein [Bdellovibrionales bacterium]
LGEVQFSNLANLDFEVEGVGHLRATPTLDVVEHNTTLVPESVRFVRGSFFGIALFAIAVLAFLLTREFPSAKVEQELQQQVVQLMKRVPLKPMKQNATMENSKTETPKTKLDTTSAVKRQGALAILGSLNSSKNRGGIDLGAVNTTAGPGLGGTEGSGGVQTNIYAKGLVGAPLGAGGNLQGGGGYGTKGKGGGQAGYGKLSLVGSSGASTVPLGSEALIEGGLDRDLIAAVIAKNIGQIRFCYEQGLQGNPGLAGRVSVDFTIAGSGAVSAAKVANTTLNASVVEDCILMRLKTWKFPLPQGGQDVKVSYPFVLRRAGQS